MVNAAPAVLADQPAVHADQPNIDQAASAFGGGWIGWIEFAGTSWFGFFDLVLRRDPAGQWWLESIADQPGLDRLASTINTFADPANEISIGNPTDAPTDNPFNTPIGTVLIDQVTGLNRDQHLAAVENAISAIRAGELYQVNICGQLTGRLTGSAIELFAAGLAQLEPDYAAFLRTPDRTIVSLSPELFLDRQTVAGQNRVRTAPIKGTRRRTVPGGRLDDAAAQQLLHSSKDRAENIMIVDLMRNDLSRVCLPGTVRPIELLAVRPAPGVWHLVSDVTGVLRDGVGDPQLLEATFPPGSVTGAPKLRSLELIAELEPQERGLYTGVIGYSSPVSHRSELNVAIRTFDIVADTFTLGVGGGITANSVPMMEWQECLVKAAPLLALGGHRTEGVQLADSAGSCPDQIDITAGLYETMLCIDGSIVGLADHLSRLETSWLEVYGRELEAQLRAQLLAAVAGTRGRHRVRLTIRPNRSDPVIDIEPVGVPAKTISVYRRNGRIGNWRHKWADRSWLASLELADAVPLFSTDSGGVAETSRGNIAIVSVPGVLRTPVLSDDILPGITRRRLLDAAQDRGWRIELGRIGFDELEAARLVLSLSSISGAVGIQRLDDVRLGLDHDLLDQLRSWLDQVHDGS